jgi:hypothetical protein
VVDVLAHGMLALSCSWLTEPNASLAESNG